jgi:hypothetical protein
MLHLTIDLSNPELIYNYKQRIMIKKVKKKEEE